jgi:hypothetical protein
LDQNDRQSNGFDKQHLEIDVDFKNLAENEHQSLITKTNTDEEGNSKGFTSLVTPNIVKKQFVSHLDSDGQPDCHPHDQINDCMDNQIENISDDCHDQIR